jgi:hypothetical protein
MMPKATQGNKDKDKVKKEVKKSKSIKENRVEKI